MLVLIMIMILTKFTSMLRYRRLEDTNSSVCAYARYQLRITSMVLDREGKCSFTSKADKNYRSRRIATSFKR